MYGLSRYVKMKKLTASKTWMITSPLLPNIDKTEERLHKIILDRNNKQWGVIYPPNHPKDHSKVGAYTVAQLNKKGLAETKESPKDLTVHPDYDFNIPAYLEKDLLLK